MSTLVSIYQAGESLYRLFDKVCVIYEGKMAYFGPADKARQYFIDMGYEPVPRQTTADFLVAVTDPNGRILRSGFESRAPRNAIEFAQHFQRSPLAELNRRDMESYRRNYVGKNEKIAAYRLSAQQFHASYTSPESSFITSIPMQVRALMIRRVQILKGGYLSQIVQIMYVTCLKSTPQLTQEIYRVFVVQAVIMGTVFLRLSDSTATFFSRGGVLFLYVSVNFLIGE